MSPARSRALRRRYGHTRPLSDAERLHALRWYGRKYGLTADEAYRLVQSRRTVEIEMRLDDWRKLHGYPATTSPLVRGKLLEMMREEGI